MNIEFIDIFKLYKNDVFRLAYSYTKNYADTCDITQNVFIKLYKNINKFTNMNTMEDIKKWLIRVTINECKSLFISPWKRKIVSLTSEEENKQYIEVLDSDLLQSVFKLPKIDRIVIYLYYYEGYKIKEISSIIHLSETAIQTRLLRARKKLKEFLKEEYIHE